MPAPPFDAVIVGGGPAGLEAALALGRGRRRVLLCDAGPPRNAAAVEVHGFVTRDGTPPAEFRRIAREQLRPYRNVEVRDRRVEAIDGARGAFEVRLDDGSTVAARRILLATGMIDELPDLPGYAELWGRSIFQCPYCHGWEVRDQAFGFLAPSPETLGFGLLLRGWTDRVTVLTDGRFEVPDDARTSLTHGGVALDERRLARLVGVDHLERIDFETGDPLPLDVLFTRPSQRQVPLVSALGLALDEQGYVEIDPWMNVTSVPGIYAGGALTTPLQSAILGAAGGMRAAGGLNHDLAAELGGR